MFHLWNHLEQAKDNVLILDYFNIGFLYHCSLSYFNTLLTIHKTEDNTEPLSTYISTMSQGALASVLEYE